jgi:hypothetical protein
VAVDDLARGLVADPDLCAAARTPQFWGGFCLLGSGLDVTVGQTTSAQVRSSFNRRATASLLTRNIAGPVGADA